MKIFINQNNFINVRGFSYIYMLLVNAQWMEKEKND